MKSVMLAAALAGLLAGLVVAPSAQAAGRAAARPVAYDCLGWHQGQVKADTVALSCFGSVVLKIGRWTYWSGVSARSAHATLRIDLCQPNCGTGKFRTYRATVILYRARSHHGVRYYSRLQLRSRHHGPRRYTYRWSRYPGATIPVWMGGPSGRSGQ